MATVIRPEITKKSDWYLDRHRYYELKHFCMQCPGWRGALKSLDGWKGRETDISADPSFAKPTEQTALLREFYSKRIEMVELAARETDDVIGPMLLEAIVKNRSYDAQSASKRIPCCKDVYYNLYRKFFYILSDLRQ